jgi:hypothetical protein
VGSLTKRSVVSRIYSGGVGKGGRMQTTGATAHASGIAKFSIRTAVLAPLLCLMTIATGSAEVRIQSSSGGAVENYLSLFAAVRESGERVVIDGPCLSACTLVLSMIPHNRICVTRRAVLGFHAARWVDRAGREYPATEETRVVASTYPAPVRAWIRRHGGLSRRLLLLQGRELAAIYRACR